MALVQGWIPPTRQNYDLLLYTWQVAFPLVSVAWSFCAGARAQERRRHAKANKTNDTACLVAMDRQVVWHGQDICGKPLQHPRPYCLDDHGVAWFPHAAVHYEHDACAARRY